MSGSNSTKQTTLNIGGAIIQVYDGSTATDFERKVSEVCDAAQLKGIPMSTWLTPGDALPVKGLEEYAYTAPDPLPDNPTDSEVMRHQERVKIYADSKRATLALDVAYRREVKDWEDRRKIRTEGMGYLRRIFQEGKLASAMRGRHDPHDALKAMRQILGVANPQQLMSTIGAAIVAIPFTSANQRDEDVVTSLLKQILELMYLVQERLQPVTELAASTFISHLQTKLRMLTPHVPIYDNLVSNIIQDPTSLVPLDQMGTDLNVFNAVQLKIISNVENYELRRNKTGAKRSHDKAGLGRDDKGNRGNVKDEHGRKRSKMGKPERAASGVDTSTWECYNCGEIGHGQRDCPTAGKKEKHAGKGKQAKKRTWQAPRKITTKGLAAMMVTMQKELVELGSTLKASQARQMEYEDVAGMAMDRDDMTGKSTEASISYMDNLINKFSNPQYLRFQPKSISNDLTQKDLLGTILKGQVATANKSSEGNGLIIWDSGASKWMTPVKMPGMAAIGDRRVTIADGTQVGIEGSGARTFHFGTEQRVIPDVLVVPKFKDELISVSHVLRGTKDALVFTDNAAYMVIAPSNTTYMVGVQTHGLYHSVPNKKSRFSWVQVPSTIADGTASQGTGGSSDYGLINYRGIQDKTYLTRGIRDEDLDLMKSTFCQGGQNPDKDSLVAAQGSVLTKEELHEWFGHLNYSILSDSVKRNGTVRIRSLGEDVTARNCQICMKMKMRQKPIVTTDHPAPRLLYRVHTDLVFLPNGTRRGHKYWIIFIDEWSRWIEVISIFSKDDYPMEVERLVTRWENEHQEKGFKVAQIRSDGELVASNRYNEWCSAHGIIAEASPAYTKEFNGLTEANIGTVKDMGNCMRVKANLPLQFSFESIVYAGFIKNRVLHPFTDETPFFRWYGRDPDLTLVKPFGSEVWALIPSDKRSLKNPEKASQGIFLGYQGNIMPIMALLRSNGRIGRIVIAYHIRWITDSFPGIKGSSNVNPEQNSEGGAGGDMVDEVDDVDAAGGNEDEEQHQISTNTQAPNTQAPNTQNSIPTIKNSGTSEGGVTDDGDVEELWVVLGESDVSDEDEVVTPPKHLSKGQRTRWSKRLSNISEKMKQRHVEGTALLAELKAEIQDIAGCLDTIYPDVPIRERDLPMAPKSLKTALASPYGSKWAAAMLKEQDSLIRKGVWNEEVLPKTTGKKRPHVISCKWVFAYKVGKDGYLVQFKARLVARGFTQKRGVHFDKVFSPVVKIQSVRLLTAAAFASGFYMHQFDVDVAYLNGEMDFVNYMAMPPGFEKLGPNGEQVVCKLVKGLYGTRQAGRMWYQNLIQYLKEIGFSMIESDKCVMVLKGAVSSNGAPALIAIYVDDCIVMSPSMELITELKSRFHQKYSIKDLGDAKWMLKIQIERMRENGIEVLWMGQPQYVAKLKDQFNAWLPVSSRKITTPMMVSWKHDEASPVLIGQDKAIYRSIIASMSYLAQQTRLDIVCPVNHLAQFLQLPRQCHKAAVSRILGYLIEYPDLGPTYFRTKELGSVMKTFLSEGVTELSPSIAPVGASDASWGTEQNYKSRTGIIFRFAGGPVTWYSGKQVPTAASATESELYALGDAIKEAMFLRNVLTELGIKHQTGTLVLEDNTAAIDIAGDPKHHARVKHMGIRLSLIREAVTEGIVKLEWCPTAHMLADLLTKALPQETFWRMLTSIGMRRLSHLSSTEVYP